MGPAVSARYSYRSDLAVPGFDDDHPLIVFDNVCVLCSGFVQWVVRQDRKGVFRFTPAQGPLGQALYAHFHMSTGRFESNLLIADGRLHTKSDAFFSIVTRFGGVWSLVILGRLAPRSVRDWVYDRIAANRYRWFGRRETCWLPDSAMADRVL